MLNLKRASEILYDDENLVIAYKAHEVATVPLKNQSLENTLLGFVSQSFPEILSVVGKNAWEGGTLHRLDTATSGLVVFAKNQSMYDYLFDIQKQDLFIKTYNAQTVKNDRLVDKSSPLYLLNDKEFEITSYFRSFGPKSREVRPTLDIKKTDSKVLYSTKVRLSDNVFTCTISRGFRHQIRAHLSWIGYPIIGDSIYGIESTNQNLKLECTKVCFPLKNSKTFSYNLEVVKS